MLLKFRTAPLIMERNTVMNTNELTKAVAKFSNLAETQAKSAIDGAFDQISAALARGEDVRVHGFGTFKVVRQEQRQGRNPRTGEPVTIAARNGVKFRPAADVASRLG